jgi:hypothetical protein
VKRLLALLVFLLGPVVPALMAQDRVAPLLTAARQQLQALNADSASVLLERAVRIPGATPAQLVRAWVLLGAARLWRDNPVGAQDAFKLALRLDPTQRVDSLEFLHENLLREFNTARADVVPGAAGPGARPLDVRFRVAPETTLAGVDGRLAIMPRLNRPARAWVSVAAVGAPAGSEAARSQELAPGDTVPLLLDLRNPGGAPFEDGPYMFTMTAVDSQGVQQTAEFTMRLAKQPPVSSALPNPPRESELRPETLQVRQRSASTLIAGAGLGLAAAVLPAVLGRTEVNKGLASDATAYVVAGSAAVAGVIGYLNGRRAVFQPEAARANAERLRSYRAAVDSVNALNAEARRAPPIRVSLERSPTP